MTAKLRSLLVAVALLLPLDQLTKYWVVTNVDPRAPWTPIAALDGFFRLTHARNPGAVLGLLPDLPVWSFVLGAVLAIGVVLWFYRDFPPDDRLSGTALGMILAGALGNLSDRIFRGEVVDFLQFNLGLFVWPDFNVADSVVVIGVALLIVDSIARDVEQRTAEEPET